MECFDVLLARLEEEQMEAVPGRSLFWLPGMYICFRYRFSHLLQQLTKSNLPVMRKLAMAIILRRRMGHAGRFANIS